MAEQFQAIPLAEPTFVSPTYERPDATTVSIIRNRGNWTSNTVYNVNDFATYIGDGTYTLIVCTEAHNSGELFDQTKWAVIVDFLQLLASPDSGLEQRVADLELAIANGDFELIDGTSTTLIVKRFTAAELGGFVSNVPLVGEFWYQTDGTVKLALGDGVTGFDALANLLLLDISSDLETLLADAQIAASDADIAREQARAWAAASPGIPIEPGLESARAERIKIAGLLRTLAAFPSREITGTSGALIKTISPVVGDEFRQILMRNTAPATFEVIKDWNTTPAIDGSTGIIAAKVWNLGTSTVQITGQIGSAVPAVLKTGYWPGVYRFTVDPPVLTPDQVVSISVPAGNKRKLYVSTFEITASSTSHQVSLASSVGTVTTAQAATAPTGDYNSGLHVNAKSFLVALPDAVAPTPVTLTFDLTADTYSFTYRVRSYNNVDATSDPSGASAVHALVNTGTVTPQANSICAFDFASQASVLPITSITGLDNVEASVVTGSHDFKDHTIWGGEKGGAPTTDRVVAGNITFAAPGKHWAWLGISMDPATVGATEVEIIGDVMVPANKAVLIEALSDGRTFLLSGGTP